MMPVAVKKPCTLPSSLTPVCLNTKMSCTFTWSPCSPSTSLTAMIFRLRDGSRKIIAVSEVLGLHGDQVKVQDIFVFKQTGVSEDGKVQGWFTATGIIPKYFDHLQSSGEGVPKDLFTPVPDPAGQGGK